MFVDELSSLLECGELVFSLPTWHTRDKYQVPSKLKPGDHIRVQFRVCTAFHHGIYVSDNEVIHFHRLNGPKGVLGNNNEVISTSLDKFKEVGREGSLEVREYSSEEKSHLYSADEIISRAKSRVGERGYKLCINNCEHFANWCTLGNHYSSQVNNWLEWIPVADIYRKIRERFIAAQIEHQQRVHEKQCRVYRQIQAAIEKDKRQLAAIMISCNDAFLTMDRACKNGDLDALDAGLSNLNRSLGITLPCGTRADIIRDIRNGKARLR